MASPDEVDEKGIPDDVVLPFGEVFANAQNMLDQNSPVVIVGRNAEGKVAVWSTHGGPDVEKTLLEARKAVVKPNKPPKGPKGPKGPKKPKKPGPGNEGGVED